MIVLVIATIFFCMGIVTGITKAPTVFSTLEWAAFAIAIKVIFGGLA